VVIGTQSSGIQSGGKGPLVNPGANLGVNPGERVANPALNMGVTQDLSENVILTTVDDLYNWTRLSSLFPLLYGTACCFIGLPR
jgi:NAD(P)H-quinone oxidoreductase subunit K